ncbi:MAG: PIN domain-containing protein [Candidatus Acidiferrales bacterium]
MPTEYRLDTNILIYYFNDVHAVGERIERAAPARLPFITAVELLHGAKRSARRAENLRKYSDFLDGFLILYPSRPTLDIYSDLQLALGQRGTPIPQNDLWQAAIAVQHQAVLVTNDEHFASVPGLQTENWAR